MPSYNYHLEQMEYHRRELEKLMAYGDDDLPIGTVLFFEKCYMNRGAKSKYYKYVALKSDSQSIDCWYTCGPKSPGPYSWDKLVSFMSDGISGLGVLATDTKNWNNLSSFRSINAETEDAEDSGPSTYYEEDHDLPYT